MSTTCWKDSNFTLNIYTLKLRCCRSDCLIFRFSELAVTLSVETNTGSKNSIIQTKEDFQYLVHNLLNGTRSFHSQPYRGSHVLHRPLAVQGYWTPNKHIEENRELVDWNKVAVDCVDAKHGLNCRLVWIFSLMDEIPGGERKKDWKHMDTDSSMVVKMAPFLIN